MFVIYNPILKLFFTKGSTKDAPNSWASNINSAKVYKTRGSASNSFESEYCELKTYLPIDRTKFAHLDPNISIFEKSRKRKSEYEEFLTFVWASAEIVPVTIALV